MTKRLSAALALLALLVVAPAVSANAQTVESGDSEVRIEQLDASRHPEVDVTVSLPPALSATELDSSAFTLFENGEERQFAVSPVSTDDLEVVLVLDASTSMRGQPLTAAKDAAQSFLDVMPSSVKVAVVSFASETQVLSEFTTDRAETATAIEGIEVAGETALYDGVLTATSVFDPAVEARRVVVLLSDGGDTISEAPIGDAIASLLKTDVAFYAIELESPENDGAAIAQMATATEGTVLGTDDPAALSSVFEEIGAQITNRYVLTYTSESYSSTDVSVEVTTNGTVVTARGSVEYPDAPAVPVTTLPPVVADPSPAPAPAPAPVDVFALRDGGVTAVAWYQSKSFMYVGVAALILAAIGIIIFSGIGRKRSGAKYGGAAAFAEQLRSGKKTALSGLAEGATALVEKGLEGERGKGLNAKLDRAGVAMRPGEFMVMAISISLAAAALGMLFFSPPIGLVAALVMAFLFRWWLNHKSVKRTKLFGEQLPDALQLMSGSLRAGFGFMQAVSTVGSEVASPCGDEFRRVKIETQLGKDVDDALKEMADRVDSEDFKWIVEAIQIHREVGGDLAEILDTVTDTIRDRNSIRRRISALSAEGKISGVVLGGLPFALAIVITFLNPTYLLELTSSTMGITMIVGGLVAMVIGIAWMRRITNLKF